MCHVFMIRHGYKVLCVLSIVLISLLKLLDNSVMRGPHLCGSEIKPFSLLRKFSFLLAVYLVLFL